MNELTRDSLRNRVLWDKISGPYHEDHGDFIKDGFAWSSWQIPEAALRVLDSVEGLKVLELGCGAGEWSIALRKRGAHVWGLDNSQARLQQANRAAEQAGVSLKLLHASAESIPLEDDFLDLVLADWGAPTFADPYLYVPEVARVLRPGGQFIFCGPTPIARLVQERTKSDGSQNLDYFQPHREVRPGGEVQFNLPMGAWVRLFRSCNFTVEDLIELQPDELAPSTFRSQKDTSLAHSWPMEHIWKVRLS